MRPESKPTHEEWEEKLSIFMGVNACIQFILDLILEALHLIPTRINHLSLTFLNAFISYKTLSAIHKKKFGFLHEDCQILWVLEVCLIFGDVWYMICDDFSLTFLYVRLLFLVFSILNLAGVSYIILKYKLWSLSYHGPNFGTRSRRQSIDLQSVLEDPQNNGDQGIRRDETILSQ